MKKSDKKGAEERSFREFKKLMKMASTCSLKRFGKAFDKWRAELPPMTDEEELELEKENEILTPIREEALQVTSIATMDIWGKL